MDVFSTLMWELADPDVKAAVADMGLTGVEAERFLQACNSSTVREYEAQDFVDACIDYEAAPWVPHLAWRFAMTHPAVRADATIEPEISMSYLVDGSTNVPVACVELSSLGLDPVLGRYIPHLDLDFEVYADSFEDGLVELARRIYVKHGGVS